jgi:2-aminoadipate transaminase
MRLNFSGVDEDAIREGVRRIGIVVREQLGLYGTLTGAAGGGGGGGERTGGPTSEEPLADVLHLPGGGPRPPRTRRTESR